MYYLFILRGPRWQSGNTLASHLWGWGLIPARPQVGKLVVACRRSAVYSTEPWPTVCTGFFCLSNYPSWFDLYSVESDVKPQINELFISMKVYIWWSFSLCNPPFTLQAVVPWEEAFLIGRTAPRSPELFALQADGHWTQCFNCQ